MFLEPFRVLLMRKQYEKSLTYEVKYKMAVI